MVHQLRRATLDMRQASCQQVIDKMEELGVPGFFVGDLNSYRSLETRFIAPA